MATLFIDWQQFWVTDTICQVDLPEVIQVAFLLSLLPCFVNVACY